MSMRERKREREREREIDFVHMLERIWQDDVMVDF
jgi:hypothetical protein